jgi:hypothetical protein
MSSDVQDMVYSLTLIIDENDSQRHEQILAVARAAVLEDMGEPAPTVEQYRRDFNHGDTTGYQRVVGIAVAYQLQEWLDELEIDEWWKAIMIDVLDLGSSDVRDALGYHYLPEPSDLEKWLTSDVDPTEDEELDPVKVDVFDLVRQARVWSDAAHEELATLSELADKGGGDFMVSHLDERRTDLAGEAWERLEGLLSAIEDLLA